MVWGSTLKKTFQACIRSLKNRTPPSLRIRKITAGKYSSGGIFRIGYCLTLWSYGLNWKNTFVKPDITANLKWKDGLHSVRLRSPMLSSNEMIDRWLWKYIWKIKLPSRSYVSAGQLYMKHALHRIISIEGKFRESVDASYAVAITNPIDIFCYTAQSLQIFGAYFSLFLVSNRLCHKA